LISSNATSTSDPHDIQKFHPKPLRRYGDIGDLAPFSVTPKK
jgi:hypothetical protein